MKQLVPAVLAAIACVSIARPARAQEEYEQNVQFQLDLVKAFANSVGWEKSHDYHIDSMNEGDTGSFTASLDEGWEYRIVTFCDQDCSDVDLYLDDENGNEIDKDEGTDYTPILAVRPRWSGQFTIRVKMYECSSEPCFFGIGIFGVQVGKGDKGDQQDAAWSGLLDHPKDRHPGAQAPSAGTDKRRP